MGKDNQRQYQKKQQQQPEDDVPVRLIVPNSMDAERAILGSILLDNEAFNFSITQGISTKSFYSRGHLIIFQRMNDLMEKGCVIDLVTLSEELTRDDMLEKAGGAAYIAGLTDGVPIGTMAGMGEYCRIVKEMYTLRRAIQLSESVTSQCFERVESGKVLEFAQRGFFEITEDKLVGGFRSVRDVLTSDMGNIEKLFTRGIKGDGVLSGLTDLDNLTGGLRNSELIVLAARPSGGKTSLALNMASDQAIRKNEPVGIFSLEMDRQALVIRMLCAEGRVHAHRLRNGMASQEDWQRIGTAAGIVGSAPIYIDDASSSSITELRAKARQLKTEKGIKALYVDYLQLITGRGDNRTEEVGFISRQLKACAKELKIPVVALAQLNRDVEKRQNPRPQLSDLRESGGIEQDADVVLFLYPLEAAKGEDNSSVRRIGAYVAKNRNGPTGETELLFLGHWMKFVLPEKAELQFDYKADAAGDRE